MQGSVQKKDQHHKRAVVMNPLEVGSDEHKAHVLAHAPHGFTDEFYKLMFVDGLHFKFEDLDCKGKFKAMMKLLRDNPDFLTYHMEHTAVAFDWNILDYAPFTSAYPRVKEVCKLKQMNAK